MRNSAGPDADPWGDWRQQAACRACPADLFFPVGSMATSPNEIRAAKAVCESCPVVGSCLSYALETNQESGVWGGTSEEERRKLRRRWVAAGRRWVGATG